MSIHYWLKPVHAPAINTLPLAEGSMSTAAANREVICALNKKRKGESFVSK